MYEKLFDFFRRRAALAAVLILLGSFIWAGDTAVFVDLGFSPDGKTYMFGQYGVHSENLRPWADLYIVDVPANSFVVGGKISYTHNSVVTPGQDGSGALYRLISRSSSMADRYNISFLFQGQPLYISMENGVIPSGGETVEFRDFEKSSSFRARLNTQVEGSGINARSSFYISLERQGGGAAKNYVVGNPQLKRGGITGYRIRKVMTAPRDGSLVFVIEMRRPNASGGVDFRYMVETIRL